MNNLITSLRSHPLINYGPSPKASSQLLFGIKILAILLGKLYVTPEHIQILAEKVLSHRICIRPHGIEYFEFGGHLNNLKVNRGGGIEGSEGGRPLGSGLGLGNFGREEEGVSVASNLKLDHERKDLSVKKLISHFLRELESP